jgi:hypothetical protein
MAPGTEAYGNKHHSWTYIDQAGVCRLLTIVLAMARGKIELNLV